MDQDIKDEWVIGINKLIQVKKDLKAGFNSFLIQFVKWMDNTGSASDINMKIEYIYIDGLRNSDFKCKKCVNSFSKKGSDSCNFCLANYYLDENTIII